MKKHHITTKAIKKYLHKNKIQKPVCKAPFISMSIGITGYVSPCCYTQSFHAESDRISKYPDESLMEIWKGENFNHFRRNLKRKRYPKECHICETSLVYGNFKSAKMKMYEGYKPDRKYPVFLEIAIDNTCNLECVMCNSQLSSKIAKRKGVNYDNGIDPEQFRKDLQPIIPHLQECIFSGGESFLSKTYRDIWKDILRVNPNCRISVNTNGTVLTDEIKALMEAGNFFLNISIDSVNKTTYEKIRRGASFDQVMKNLDYFIDYSRRKDTILSMPVCPLTSNYKELPDIVAFCNSHGMFLEFVHVFNALNVNLQYASKAVLEDAYQVCSNVNIVPNDQVSEHNVNMLNDLCNKIQLWIREKTFREIFIDNLKPNESKYHKSMQKIETKVKTYLHQQKNNDEANAGFVLWKQKKDKLFDQLPNFMHDDFFYQSIVTMKPHILYNYIISMPLDELKISLQSFAKRIISDIGSSHTLKP